MEREAQIINEGPSFYSHSKVHVIIKLSLIFLGMQEHKVDTS